MERHSACDGRHMISSDFSDDLRYRNVESENRKTGWMVAQVKVIATPHGEVTGAVQVLF